MGSAVADSTRLSDTVRRPLATILAVAAATVAADQATKAWAVAALSDPARVIDLVGSLRLRLLYNYGTAFSLTSDSGPVVSIVAVVVVVVLLASARGQRAPAIVASYGLIVGGTVGNLIDRFTRPGDGFAGGGVVDFVDLQWFPVFNLADSALTIGIGLLVLATLRGPDPDQEADDA